MTDLSIHPIDWKNLKKGTSISEEEIIEFWKHHFPDKEWNDFSLLKVQKKIEELREKINDPIVIKQTKIDDKYILEILTDKEAPDYLAKQATAGIKKQRKNARRLLTDVDTNNLDEAEKRRLETKQIHHAFIAAAADGARRSSLKSQREGESLPKSLIKKSGLLPPDY